MVLIVGALAGLPVYVQPQVDALQHADAIVVLGGEGRSRYRVGLELAEQGWADNLVVSDPSEVNAAWGKDMCVAPHPGLRVHCFIPDPGTTKGEARELRRLATRYGWRKIIVVTFRPHISRARFIIEQCFDGGLVMVSSPARISIARWVFEYGYQTAGYLRSVLQPGC